MSKWRVLPVDVVGVGGRGSPVSVDWRRVGRVEVGVPIGNITLV